MHTKPVKLDRIVFNLFGFIEVFDTPVVLEPGQIPEEVQGFFCVVGKCVIDIGLGWSVHSYLSVPDSINMGFAAPG